MPSFESSKKQENQGYLSKSQLSYHEIITYLDNHWAPAKPITIKKLNAFLGNPAAKLSSIIIAGTSGKSTTIHYLKKLLLQEGLKIGISTSPHFNFYNERISINEQILSNEVFTFLANEILDIIKNNQIEATSKDILTAMAALYFKQQQVDLVLIEQENSIDFDPVSIFTPTILGITRLILPNKEILQKAIANILSSVSTKTSIASADQSKLVLHDMAKKTKELNAHWIMPVRKTAPLPYPFEQLHGRCAALAERISQTYMNALMSQNNIKLSTMSLLHFTKKQRGRTSLNTKPHANNSIKTIEQFWKSVNVDVPYRFQIIDKALLAHY